MGRLQLSWQLSLPCGRVAGGRKLGILQGTAFPPWLQEHVPASCSQVVGKDILPRPIMNVALTYDHRLIDGREGVTFLKRIKEVVEDPRRLLLDV